MPNSVNLSSESWEAVREERTEPLVYLTSLFGADSIFLSVQDKVNSRFFDGLRSLLQTLVVFKTSSLMALGSKEFETDASLLPDHRCVRTRTNDLPNDILFVNTQYNVCSSSYRTGVGASRTRQGLVCSRERASPWTRRKASKEASVLRTWQRGTWIKNRLWSYCVYFWFCAASNVNREKNENGSLLHLEDGMSIFFDLYLAENLRNRVWKTALILNGGGEPWK